MDAYNNTPGTLSICSSTFTSVSDALLILIQNGVSATLTETHTIMKRIKKNTPKPKVTVETAEKETNDKDDKLQQELHLWIERGCTIQIHGLKPELYESKVWDPLQRAFDLGCGFLIIPGQYSGCILNFIRPSACDCRRCLTPSFLSADSASSDTSNDTSDICH